MSSSAAFAASIAAFNERSLKNPDPKKPLSASSPRASSAALNSSAASLAFFKIQSDAACISCNTSNN